METSLPQIQKNLANIYDRIAESERRASRPQGSVKLIGVTKHVDADATRALALCGCVDLAESRPQQLWSKAEVLMDLPVRWHLIGHLQRNKVKKTLEYASVLHSVDSERLLKQLASDSLDLQSASTTFTSSPARFPVEFLVEVNATDDHSKTGLSFESGQELIRIASDFPTDFPIRIRGLMGMSSLHASDDQRHREFESIRTTRDRWEQEFGISLPELSMGMSDDFEIAIEHGATMVRIGSKLFE